MSTPQGPGATARGFLAADQRGAGARWIVQGDYGDENDTRIYAYAYDTMASRS
jgi:hypothetical protein